MKKLLLILLFPCIAHAQGQGCYKDTDGVECSDKRIECFVEHKLNQEHYGNVVARICFGFNIMIQIHEEAKVRHKQRVGELRREIRKLKLRNRSRRG